MSIPKSLKDKTFVVEHNPNMPCPFLVRLCGYGRGYIDKEKAQSTCDAVGYGVTLAGAGKKALAHRAAQEEEAKAASEAYRKTAPDIEKEEERPAGTWPCTFGISWKGPCGARAVGDVNGELRCAEHKDVKCSSCGAPATHECDNTTGPGCAAPLCAECEHGPDGFKGEHVRRGA